MDEFAFHFKYGSLRVLRFAFFVAQFFLVLAFCFAAYRGDRMAVSYVAALGVAAFLAHRAVESRLKPYILG